MSFARILVGHDGGPHAADALALGRVLAEPSGAELVIGRVVPFGPYPLAAASVEVMRAYEEHQQAVRAELEAIAAPIGGRAAAVAVAASSPAAGLHSCATEVDADLVVIGSSHRGKLGRVLAGNVGTGLLSGLDRAVAVAPAGYAERELRRLETIGVAVDGSPELSAALDAAGALASEGALVRVIGVVEPPPEVRVYPWFVGWTGSDEHERLVAGIRTGLERAAARVPPGIQRETVVLDGAPVTVLTDEAAGLDLLVLGSRGYGPARRVLLGSVSAPLLTRAACAVLVTPRLHEEADVEGSP